MFSLFSNFDFLEMFFYKRDVSIRAPVPFGLRRNHPIFHRPRSQIQTPQLSEADMAEEVAEYGSWVSPISSDLLVQKSISLKEVRIDPLDKGRALLFD